MPNPLRMRPSRVVNQAAASSKLNAAKAGGFPEPEKVCFDFGKKKAFLFRDQVINLNFFSICYF
uniref:Uncharacterized protein n=1 Tax=Oryza meridionalis TaxID=40149 RepID=A0A0E0EIU7_9ORYZ